MLGYISYFSHGGKGLELLHQGTILVSRALETMVSYRCLSGRNIPMPVISCLKCYKIYWYYFLFIFMLMSLRLSWW